MALPRLNPVEPALPAPDLTRVAEERVLQELVDGLIYEDFLGITGRATLLTTLPAGLAIPSFSLEGMERYFHLPLGDSGRSLLFRVQPQSALQPYRLSRPPLLLLSPAARWRRLTAVEVVQWLVDTLAGAEKRGRFPGLESFLEDLRGAGEPLRLALEAAPSVLAAIREPSPDLLAWEQLAALQDRPFHPTARVKRGWRSADQRRFGAEGRARFALSWLAVRAEFLQGPAARGLGLARQLLSEPEQVRLATAFQEARLSPAEYTALPVHPWQMAHLLPTLYGPELAGGSCVPLVDGLGQVRPTASIRSLLLEQCPSLHVKLPLGITSLGALRLLPPRYLHNGTRAQQLLADIIVREPSLAGRLQLCDEQEWLAFHEPEGDPFDDRAGHLACLLRRYPSHLVRGSDELDLLPMAALAVRLPDEGAPAARFLLERRAGGSDRVTVLQLFMEVSRLLLGVALRCFAYGVMPELHGQNVLLILRAGIPGGLLLRDHDTLRLHLPWLTAQGFEDPDYLLKPATPNTLLTSTPEQLLAYFQTLGIQVNLQAIARAWAEAYSIEVRLFWECLKQIIEEELSRWEGPAPARATLERALLHKQEWPSKLLITPLLERAGSGGGSMPSALGWSRNPFAPSPAREAAR